MLHGIQDEGQALPLLKYLQRQLKEGLNCDVMLKIPHLDESNHATTEFDYIKAHKSILAARSTYFAEVLQQQQLDQVEEFDVIPITEPVAVDVIKAYLEFLYTGEIHIQGMKNIERLIALANVWGQHQTISKICSIDQRTNRFHVYLDLTAEILSQLKKDFSMLIHNPTMYPDMTIQLHLPMDEESQSADDEIQEPFVNIHAHQLFLCQSGYIQKTFASGMQESTERLVQFSDISMQGMMQILKFLYTSELSISPETCLVCHVLFCSSM